MILALLIVSILLISCDDGGVEPVRFGKGEVPGSVPADFPVPPHGVIGATMVDTINHRTEFSVNVESDLLSLVQFFTIGLVNEGYVVDRSGSLGQTTWEIGFSRGELSGTILVSSDGGGLSQAVVSMNAT
ncbi:MAG: hypothetical protein Q8Q29_06345 [Actinomycetota bacterium]|nr:hypothetical protein [Actinomycetota bacterium]